MFIENEVNIHTLVIEILNVPNYDSYQNDMFEIILRNRNFINNNVGSGNCSNTLNTIILYKVNFNVVFTRQIVNLNKPFKLKSLFIDERSQIDESIKLLLQKSGDYLENIGYKFCRSLSLSEQQILNNIIIYCNDINSGSIILRNLCQDGYFTLYKGIYKEKEEGQILAIMNTFIKDSATVNIKSEDLFSLKNEYKEFELYNIKVRYYDDLFIKVHEFIKEMD
ncbi:hypothetical protein RhiirB3_445541 [Rhizophagus irregularis]|nr:hypothetical protein RhiirB3_445541 [Rhizophagus irregularis]